MQNGVDFDTLCNGTVQYYSFNLADLGSETTVKGIKQRLIEKLEDTVRALETGSGRKIVNIYIGKTFIKQRVRQDGMGYQIFNPLNPLSWSMQGINSYWEDHKRKEHGRDGLVVLGAITRETMPERCRDRVHQEDFALAMEQKLLHHYLLSHPDPRVVNKTFFTKYMKRSQYAYGLYMTFRYEGESPHESEKEASLLEESNDHSSRETSDSSFSMEQDSDPGPRHISSPSDLSSRESSFSTSTVEKDSEPASSTFLEEQNDISLSPSSRKTNDPQFSTIEHDSDSGRNHTFSPTFLEEPSDLSSSQSSRETSDPPFLIITIEHDSDQGPSHTPSPPQSLPLPSRKRRLSLSLKRRQQKEADTHLQQTSDTESGTPSRPLTSSSLATRLCNRETESLRTSKAAEPGPNLTPLKETLQENLPSQANPSSSKRKLQFDETRQPKRRRDIVIDLTNSSDKLKTNNKPHKVV